jgi:uncharacterized damage-inducible protein DinB
MSRRLLRRRADPGIRNPAIRGTRVALTKESGMSLSAAQAKGLAEFLLADLATERETNKRVIEAVPEGKEGYSPDPKSMTAINLAWHIASAEWFFLQSVCEGKFEAGESSRPENIRNAKDVLAWYEQTVPPVLARASALSGEQLAQVIDFFGMFQAPAAVYLNLLIKHGVHHRGQLSAYLRPMGAKVPGIYGPSADAPVK